MLQYFQIVPNLALLTGYTLSERLYF